jgi:hypothetical protein
MPKHAPNKLAKAGAKGQVRLIAVIVIAVIIPSGVLIIRGPQFFSSSSSQTTAANTDFSVGYFGDSYRGLSAILGPPNTMIWANFQLQEGPYRGIGAGAYVYTFPSEQNASITIGIYLNGKLIGKSAAQVPSVSDVVPPGVSGPNSSEPQGTLNSIAPIPSTVMFGQFPVVVYATGLEQGANVSVCLIASQPVWLAGWSQSDLSSGTGPAYGQSRWQLPGLNEVPGQLVLLPDLPQKASTTLPFELQVSGDVIS